MEVKSFLMVLSHEDRDFFYFEIPQGLNKNIPSKAKYVTITILYEGDKNV